MSHTNNDFVRKNPNTTSEKLNVVKGAMGEAHDDQYKGKGQGAPKDVDIWSPKFKHMRVTAAENGYSVELTPHTKHIKSKAGATVGQQDVHPIDKTYLVSHDHPAHEHLHNFVRAVGHVDDSDGDNDNAD